MPDKPDEDLSTVADGDVVERGDAGDAPQDADPAEDSPA